MRRAVRTACGPVPECGAPPLVEADGRTRNIQQDDDEIAKNTSTIRVLKNRYAGTTGVGSYLLYSTENGRMTEIENPFKESENEFKTQE